MPHKPDPERKLSVKTKLIIIAVMFILINLIFYVGFDSSDEAKKSVELEDKNRLNSGKNTELEQEPVISITP